MATTCRCQPRASAAARDNCVLPVPGSPRTYQQRPPRSHGEAQGVDLGLRPVMDAGLERGRHRQAVVMGAGRGVGGELLDGVGAEVAEWNGHARRSLGVGSGADL